MEVIGSCKNAFEALETLKRKSVDLIFLDINMPEISGLSFMKLIDKKTKVIFTTAYREYAVDGFDLQAVDWHVLFDPWPDVSADCGWCAGEVVPCVE